MASATVPCTLTHNVKTDSPHSPVSASKATVQIRRHRRISRRAVPIRTSAKAIYTTVRPISSVTTPWEVLSAPVRNRQNQTLNHCGVSQQDDCLLPLELQE